MLDGMMESLHRIRNPFAGIRKRFTRYVVIVSCLGAVSFVIAWAMLNAGIHPFITLVVSMSVAGLLNYGVMELWGFPNRKGAFSAKRFAGNVTVGVAGFLARYLVLMWGLSYFVLPPPLDNALPLALAYIVSFMIGYFLRSRVVFRNRAA